MSKTKELKKLTEAYRDVVFSEDRYKQEYRKLFNYTEAIIHQPDSELATEGRKYVQGIIDERDKLKKERGEVLTTGYHEVVEETNKENT